MVNGVYAISPFSSVIEPNKRLIIWLLTRYTRQTLGEGILLSFCLILSVRF